MDNPQVGVYSRGTPKYFQDCYEESRNFLEKWKQRKVAQLVLLNNMQRGDQTISSTLLLTLFNRVLSSLYDDKIQIKFLPSQGINQDKLNSYNILAQSDYQEMEKAKLDYDWCWDALFFNRGYVETLRFDKNRKIMEPCVINPLTFGYDPYFENVQDWRYYWKWLTKSRIELERLISNGTITGIDKVSQIPSGVDEYIWNYKTLRDQAKQAIEPGMESFGGDIYQIMEFYGYNEDGKKTVYWLDKNLDKVLWSEVLKLEDLDYGDGTKVKGSKWPIVTKEAFREPHASINFGIADLLEDKHRAKSVLLNLAFIAAKDKANPVYWYDPNRVKDVTQFMSRQINQHIPVEGDGALAVGPINTKEPLTPELTNFISMLQQEANAPIGTGVTLQPQKNKTSNTATEAAIDQQLNDMAQSLQSKIMQFGESEFWSHWFHRYAKHGKELGTKIANIVGVKGVTSTEVDLSDFNTDFPPGVFVYSAKDAEYKNLVKRRDMMQLYPAVQASMDANGFRNWQKHIFWPLMIEDPSQIDVMLPKTLDEIQAESENERLKQDEWVDALPTDDHVAHLYTHQMLEPKTWAGWFHIEMHQKMLAEQKAQQQAAQLQQMSGQMTGQMLDNNSGGMGNINIGAEKSNPMEAASSLKAEINPNNSMRGNTNA